MVSKSAALKIGVLLGCGLLSGLGWWVWQRQVDELRTYAPDLSQVAYVGSESCRACHQDQFTHWSQSHHHKMTQPANPETVVGDFNNATYTYQGVTSRMFRQGDEFFMETLDLNGRLGVAKIVRTIGSRRFQQYVTQVGTTFYRLPIAWNIEKKNTGSTCRGCFCTRICPISATTPVCGTTTASFATTSRAGPAWM